MSSFFPLIFPFLIFTLTGAPQVTRNQWGIPGETSDQIEQPARVFKIKVVDDRTHRGVPLVELKTNHEVCYHTDNNGIVAFYEPGLMNQDVYFHIRSHGYEFPADGFGFRGRAVKTIPGDSIAIPVKRINIAERLYRITGAGLFAHSLLAGEPVQLKKPLLNGKVMGQDTFMETLYNGKIFWVWGDTGKPSYPLGNFSTSGATSDLPGKGGLDPSVGIDLTYFTDETGFSKKMCPVDGPGPVWIHWLTVLKDSSGKERLYASWTRVKTLGENYEQGLALFNDSAEIFEPILRFPLNSPFFPDGHSFRALVNGQEYIYFDGTNRYPVRVKADPEHICDLSVYESFTCLKEGARFDTTRLLIDRNGNGPVRWGWKRNGEPLDHAEEQFLLKRGILKPGEGYFNQVDAETGKSVQSMSGSVFWNSYRQKWVMIFEEIYGTSFLGEVWYAEGDTPVGPWVYCRKIVTHDNYSFYNVGQHPLFDQEGGSLIYFEGTYTHSFTDNPVPTPRYNYNQIMYRLNLKDPDLFLPEPVYCVDRNKSGHGHALRREVDSMAEWGKIVEIPFFAYAPDRCPEGCIPVYSVRVRGKIRLTVSKPGKREQKVLPAFCGVPEGKPSPMVVPLYEFRDRLGDCHYSTEIERSGWERSEKPVCQVWKNPASVLMLDAGVKPVDR